MPWRLVDAAGAELASGSTLGGGVDGPGPTGSDASADAGQSWRRFDSASFDTVDCAGGWVCWASGEQGRVAYLVRQP